MLTLKYFSMICVMSFIALMFGVEFSRAMANPQEELPPLLEKSPTEPYDVLSPVGAGKKTIDLAREQLRREAKKVQAEAVIRVICEPGGIGRQGMTWYSKDAYCRGVAIRYR